MFNGAQQALRLPNLKGSRNPDFLMGRHRVIPAGSV